MENRMKRNRIKKIAALVIAGVMCLQFTGCGKEKKKTEKLDQYDAVKQTEIAHSLGTTKIIDGVLYGSYNDFDEKNNTSKTGMVTYNFETKETQEAAVEDSELSVQSFDKDSEGNLVIKGQKYYTDNDKTPRDTGESTASTGTGETEDTTYSYSDVELKYDSDFKLISRNEGEKITASYDGKMSEEMLVSQVCTDDGKRLELYNSMSDGKYYIKIFDTEGNEAGQIPIDSMIDSLYKLPNGDIVCMVWGDGGVSLYKIDVEGKKVGDKLADVSKYNMSKLFIGHKDSVMFVSGGILYRCYYENGKVEKILKFMDSDIDADTVNEVFELEDGTLVCVFSTSDYKSAEIDYLVKQDPKNAVKKTEITMGVFYLDDDLQKKVIDFNKTNEKYKIVVTEYYGDGEEDYDKAMSKFNSDVASGKCPDIVNFNGLTASMEQYVEKGILEELTPYLEKDSDINIDDFVQSVVEAYKIEGKLYVLPQYFSVNGYIGATSAVGKDISWTMDEFINLAKSLPENEAILQNITSDGLLSMLCTYNLNKYVNWTTGECLFDTGNFAKLLEFCSNYKTSEEFYKDYDYENYVSEVTLIRNKQLLLRSVYMDDTQEYMLSKVIYGEDVSFKGYPCEKGNGSIVATNSSLLAISAKSKNKDSAWKFIRQFYLPTEQENAKNYFNGFPIRQDDLDKMLNDAMIPEKYTDENGQEQIMHNTWGFDDITIEIPEPAEDDIKAIKDIINSIDTISGSDEKISSIIDEETKAFFEGQKSADEVAKVIQSRVSMYVKENR